MAATTGPAEAGDRLDTASLTPGTEIYREADTPRMLGHADAERYRRIFDLQAAGDWAAADAEISGLQDRMLMGEVLAQRYLHRKYRSSYAELAEWLAHHADEPDARAIYALAQRRRPAQAPALAKPIAAPVPLRGIKRDPADLRPAWQPSTKNLTAAERERSAELKAKIRHLARSNPSAAERLLHSAAVRSLFDDAEFDAARADVAEGWLFLGKDQRALILSASARTAAYQPLAHWNAGLAAWRLKRVGEARTHFEALARLPNVSGWNRAAAAYWAARVHRHAHQAKLARYWLQIAAEHPRTFYGLLARRALGLDTWFGFNEERFSEADADAVVALPAGRRALALLQIGENERAELELRMLAGQADPKLLMALVGIADRGNMPALSIELASRLAALDGKRHDHALYPVPRWRPRGGFRVDRALLFALMRQESEFFPDAESPAGAIGLMQLMPSTAEAVASRAGIAPKPTAALAETLRDPEVNLTLAQLYVEDLIGTERIGRNVLLIAAAYNTGPGAVVKWKMRPEYRHDPLLFLESMPSRETRIFVQRVMTNYWIYRARFGQKTPGLDALASGKWPTYVAFDTLRHEGIRHASAR